MSDIPTSTTAAVLVEHLAAQNLLLGELRETIVELRAAVVALTTRADASDAAIERVTQQQGRTQVRVEDLGAVDDLLGRVQTTRTARGMAVPEPIYGRWSFEQLRELTNNPQPANSREADLLQAIRALLAERR